jgi:hypothetical protein
MHAALHPNAINTTVHGFSAGPRIFPQSGASAGVTTYKMRGVLAGVYNYWTSTDPALDIPPGTTNVQIAAVIYDESGL